MLSVIRAIADRLGCNSRLLRPEPVFVIIIFSIQWDIGLLFAMKLAASLTPNCWRRVPASLNLALGIWHVSRQTRVQEVVSSVHYWNTFCIFVRLFCAGGVARTVLGIARRRCTLSTLASDISFNARHKPVSNFQAVMYAEGRLLTDS